MVASILPVSPTRMPHYLAVARALALIPLALQLDACGARTGLLVPESGLSDATDRALDQSDAPAIDTAPPPDDSVSPAAGRCEFQGLPGTAISCPAGSLCAASGGKGGTVQCIADAGVGSGSACGLISCANGRCRCIDEAASTCGCVQAIAVLPPPDLAA